MSNSLPLFLLLPFFFSVGFFFTFCFFSLDDFPADGDEGCLFAGIDDVDAGVDTSCFGNVEEVVVSIIIHVDSQ